MFCKQNKSLKLVVRLTLIFKDKKHPAGIAAASRRVQPLKCRVASNAHLAPVELNRSSPQLGMLEPTDPRRVLRSHDFVQASYAAGISPSCKARQYFARFNRAVGSISIGHVVPKSEVRDQEIVQHDHSQSLFAFGVFLIRDAVEAASRLVLLALVRPVLKEAH